MASSLRRIDRSSASNKLPDRLNELWRYGHPHRHAQEVAKRLQSERSCGDIYCDAPAACIQEFSDADEQAFSHMKSAGSHALLSEQIKHFGQGLKLRIAEQLETPIHIRYSSSSLFCPITDIHLEAGACAHIIEEHQGIGASLIFCLRRIHLEAGARLVLELHEKGSGESQCFNISDININDADFRHLTQHDNHLWAREETGVSIYQTLRNEENEHIPLVELYSANQLQGKQELDQRTDQDHLSAHTKSRLLYKNVIDEKASAIFNGNILVAEGAHYSDAVQYNRNLMLSKDAVIHSLPGLEILADKVRCTHGSASGPINKEKLFYLGSRGINEKSSREMLTQAYLDEVLNLFKNEKEA